MPLWRLPLSSRHSVVPEYLQSLRNVAISLGEPHDPRLPSGLVKLRFWCTWYLELLLYNLVLALKPDARVGIVDASAKSATLLSSPLAVAR
jgi:hypothetical protein